MFDSATLWTVACQAPLSMGFPRQEYWSGLLFPFPGDLPNTGIKPLLHGQDGSLPLSHQGTPIPYMCIYIYTLYNVNYIYVCVCVCVCVCVYVFFLAQQAIHMLGMSSQKVSASKSTKLLAEFSLSRTVGLEVALMSTLTMGTSPTWQFAYWSV